MYDVDPVDLLAREALRDRAALLVAEACAWSVGLSDRPHLVRRHGRVTPTGLTLGMRAESGLSMSGEEDLPLELGEVRPGTFGDALGALAPDGRLHADRLDDEVLAPYVLATCVAAAARARDTEPAAWAELLDDLGEDGDDLEDVVRAAEWEAPLRTEAEQLLLAALADVPLVEVEAEGLPLSLVRAAEAETRAAVRRDEAARPSEEELAGALFLAEVALREADLPLPVPQERAADLLDALAGQGLEPDEVAAVLPHLPVHADTVEVVVAVLARTSG